MTVRSAEEPGYAVLAGQRHRLGRASRSEQIAEILRDGVLDGSLPPGSRLSEPDICEALGVSRNTLREAFRLLADQRLAVHQLNRGTFVRLPDPDDVRELYSCRRIIELAAVRAPREPARLDAVAAAVDLADEHAARDDWAGVGTADVAFHRAITALNASSRIDEFMAGIWNELRLVFHVMADPLAFHRPYLERNRTILDALRDRRHDEAVTLLGDYLDAAERQILAAYPV